jgi:hypothetical protein
MHCFSYTWSKPPVFPAAPPCTLLDLSFRSIVVNKPTSLNTSFNTDLQEHVSTC